VIGDTGCRLKKGKDADADDEGKYQDCRSDWPFRQLGDTAAAVRLFDSRPDTAGFGGTAIDDLVHAQVLVARGRAADAARLLERPPIGVSPAMSPVEILRALERGRVYERIGNKDLAIDGYSLVLRAWRNPDPALAPYVAEARAALVRLAGEKR